MLDRSQEQELLEALLEIEWKSRRRASRETLAQINAAARAALTGARSREVRSAEYAVEPTRDYALAP